MRRVMYAITTAMITIDLFRFKIIRTTVVATIILENLTRTKEMEGSWQPEHVKYSKDNVWYDREYYKRLYFSDNLGSNLR